MPFIAVVTPKRQLLRTHYLDRESWLAGRGQGIGASEAAAILGVSPWMNSMKLWRLKTGLEERQDLSRNTAVQQGNRLEGALRGMYQALYPEYQVEYHPFDTLAQQDKPWLFATLDGELIRQDKERGILEIKTATPNSAAVWEKWRDAVPEHYYIQILHQLLATGYRFAVLFAALFDRNGGVSLRTYAFEREECQEDMAYLAEKELEFWKHVEAGTLPPMVLTL